MSSGVVRVGVPAGRTSPRAAILLFVAAFVSVIVIGLVGDDLAGQGSRPPASPVASALAIGSAAASHAPTPTPVPTARASPTPLCEPPVIERMTGPLERRPARLVPTVVEGMVQPSEADGQIVVDGHSVPWSYGPGRLGRLDAAGHVAEGWTVSDDIRFGATMVSPARDGGVWLVSEASDEIVWFDGREFRDVVPMQEGTSAIAEAPDGSLWAAVNGGSGNSGEPANGLAHWDGRGWTTVCTEARGAWIDRLVVDGRGDVWIVAYSGWGFGFTRVSRFDGRRWTSYAPETESSWPDSPLGALALAPDDAVWISFGDAIIRFDGTSWTRHDAPSTIDLSGTTSLVVDRDGVAWIAAGMEGQPDAEVVGTHVVRFDGREWRQYDERDGLPAAVSGTWAVVSSLAIEGRGVVAFARNRLYGLSDGRWERVDHHAGPPDAVGLMAVSADEAWVASSADGVWHFNDGRWVRDNPPGRLGWPRSLVAGPDGMIAIATDRQVAIRRGDTWTVVRSSADDLGVIAIAFAPDGTLWASAGSSEGLVAYRWNGRTWVRRDVEPVPPNVMPSAIAFDRGGGAWLIGVGYFPHAVHLVDGRWDEVELGGDWIPGGGIAIDRAGTVWLTVQDQSQTAGIGEYNDGAWQIVDLSDLVGSYIPSNAIAASPDGTLWLGGSHGLLRFDGRQWATAVPGPYVDAVSIGRDGSVWTWGGAGLMQVRVDRP